MVSSRTDHQRKKQNLANERTEILKISIAFIFFIFSTNKQGRQNSEYKGFGQRVNVLFFLNVKWRHNDSQLENISITNSTTIIDNHNA